MGKGCFAAIVCFVLLLSSDIGAQDSNVRVVFEGNEEFSSAELSKEFAKCPFPLNSYTDNERLISIVSACLRGTVFSLYGSRGFWEIQKRTDIQSRLSESQKIITVSIDEPERVYIGKVQLIQNSSKLLSRENVLRRFPHRTGEPVNVVQLRAFIQKIRDLYYDSGYLGMDIDIDTDLRTDPMSNQNVLDIIVRLIESESFIISDISFEYVSKTGFSYLPSPGYAPFNQKLADATLRKTFGLEVGRIYSETALQQGLARLNRLGGFGRLQNSRRNDIFTASSGYSRNVAVVENYENNSVEIIITIAEGNDSK